MDLKKLSFKQKVAAAVILLVLVSSCIAYFIYVPKGRELQSLQGSLAQAEQTNAQLNRVAPIQPVTDQMKKTLAEEVPTTLDQSSFIEQVRNMEAKSGVVIQSLTFTDQAQAKAQNSPAGSQVATAPKQQNAGSSGAPVLRALQEVDGSLSLEGTYSQVREFVRQMSAISRLVTYKTWDFSTKEVPIASLIKPSDSASVSLQTAQTASSGSRASSSGASSLPANLPPSTVSDDVLTDPLLKNRTPIVTEDDFNRQLAAIKAKNAQFHTQHDLDMANLEIQQTFNRYVAGLLGESQAETILDQDYAGHFLQGANTNIRQVLGLDPLYAPSSSPLSLLLNSSAVVQSTASSGPTQTIVTVNVQFAIYDAPTASGILPQPDAVSTYQPAERSNPVEAK